MHTPSKKYHKEKERVARVRRVERVVGRGVSQEIKLLRAEMMEDEVVTPLVIDLGTASVAHLEIDLGPHPRVVTLGRSVRIRSQGMNIRSISWIPVLLAVTTNWTCIIIRLSAPTGFRSQNIMRPGRLDMPNLGSLSRL